MSALAYRIRVRNATNTADALVLSSRPDDAHPYVSAPPRGDGQSLDPITGKYTVGAYTISAIDAEIAPWARVITGQLADSRRRQQLLGRVAYIEESRDGGAWRVMVPGYVNRIRLVSALVFEFTVGETQRGEQTVELFREVVAPFDKVSCLIGGPVIGGTQTLPDKGPWRMRVSQVSAGKFVRLAYVSGWQRAPKYGSVTLDTRLHPYSYEYVTGGIRAEEATRINTLAEAYYAQEPTLRTDGIAGRYPKLAARVHNVATGAITGTFAPLNRMATGTKIGGQWLNIDLRALVENNTLNLAWTGTGDQPAQPSVGALLDVYVYPSEITEANPVHLGGHPVDLHTQAWDFVGYKWNASAAAQAKLDIGADLYVELRYGRVTKLGAYLEALRGWCGLGVRINSAGERELIAVRKRRSIPPATTVTLADLRSSDGPIFDVDEKSAINKVTLATQAFSLWWPGVSGERPIDEIVSAPRRVSVAVEEAYPGVVPVLEPHEQVYEIPGVISTNALRLDLGTLIDSTRATAMATALPLFDRRETGAVRGTLHVLPRIAEKIGDTLVLDVPHRPNDNARGGPRIVQVLQRTEVPGGADLEVEDVGVSEQPALLPSFTLAADSTDPKRYATITVTNASTLAGMDITVLVELAFAASPTSWIEAMRLTPSMLTAGSTYRTPRANAGSIIAVRLRSEKAGLLPSAYTATQSVTLTALTAPSGLTATAVTGDDSQRDLSWTVGESDVPVVVQLKHTADPATAWRTVQTLAPGSTKWRIPGLDLSTAQDVRVLHVEAPPYAGESAAVTVSFTTGNNQITLAAPDNPRAFAGSIDRATGGLIADGSYGLEVTARALPSFTQFEEAVETAVGSGTYGAFDLVPGGTLDSVQGERTRWTGRSPSDGLRRKLRAKHTRSGANDSAYTPTVTIDPWTAKKPKDYPVAIPTDFRLSPNVQGAPDALVAWVVALYTAPTDSQFGGMEYSVRARPTGETTWSAAVIVPGSRSGNDRIVAMPSTDVEVTPITVTTGEGEECTRLTGSPVAIAVPNTLLPTVTATPSLGAGTINYQITTSLSARSVRWYTQNFATDPGDISVEHTGTFMGTIDVGSRDTVQAAAPPTGEYQAATFVPYDALARRGTSGNARIQRTAPPTPPALAAHAPVSRTSTSITNSVTLPGDISLVDKLRVYVDGAVAYDIPRFGAGPGTVYPLTVSSLTPDTLYRFEYAAVSSAGGEGPKTAPLDVRTLSTTIPTPSITGYYDTTSQAFVLTVAPGADSPDGVAWHLIGTDETTLANLEPPDSTSLTIGVPHAQNAGRAETWEWRASGSRSGWTSSGTSSSIFITVPQKTGEDS